MIWHDVLRASEEEHPEITQGVADLAIAAMLVPHWHALSETAQPAPVMAVSRQVLAQDGICAVSSAMLCAETAAARMAVMVAVENFIVAVVCFGLFYPSVEEANVFEVDMSSTFQKYCVTFFLA